MKKCLLFEQLPAKSKSTRERSSSAAQMENCHFASVWHEFESLLQHVLAQHVSVYHNFFQIQNYILKRKYKRSNDFLL